MKAKDINDCDNCPIHRSDCPGGYTSGGGGQPIEPPCCSWNDDTEVYDGMYSGNEYEPSEQEIKWANQRIAEKEEHERLKKEQAYKEETKQIINRISRYGNAKLKSSGELCYTWYCPKCNRWFHAWSESSHNGITETNCNYCGEALAHSWLLD